MGRAMLSKSLIQFSVDGRGCVPSLLFGQRPKYGGSNEDSGGLLQKVLCVHCHTQCLRPCSRPPQTHASTGDSGTLMGKSGSVFWGVTSLFSWVLVCTRLRAATPSNAAELVAPDNGELRESLMNLQRTMHTAFQTRLADYRRRLDRAAKSAVLRQPDRLLREKQMRLDLAAERLVSAQRNAVQTQKERFMHLAAKLDALSPIKVMQRGYSVVLERDGAVLRSAGDVKPGDILDIILADGSVRTAVQSVKEENHESFREF